MRGAGNSPESEGLRLYFLSRCHLGFIISEHSILRVRANHRMVLSRYSSQIISMSTCFYKAFVLGPKYGICGAMANLYLFSNIPYDISMKTFI